MRRLNRKCRERGRTLRRRSEARRLTNGFEQKGLPSRRRGGSNAQSESFWSVCQRRSSLSTSGNSYHCYSGQSESGKSTTIKNFQLQYSPLSFWAERRTWKRVIHLNLVRSVRRIHNALSSLPLSESSTQDITPYSTEACCSIRALTPIGTPEDYGMADNRHKPGQQPTLSAKHQLLLMRLRPILDLDTTLTHQLLYSNFDHSSDKSGSHAAKLFVPLPSSGLVNPSLPSSWGKEVPDNPPPWSPASWRSIFSSTTGTSALQTPSTVLPCSPTSGGSLFSQFIDEPLIYASLWSNRVQSKRPTSNKRPRAHTTAVSQLAESQISALSEATGTIHGPSAVLPSASRRTSYSSIGSLHSKHSTCSQYLSPATPSLSVNGSGQSLSQTTLYQSSFGAGRTVMGSSEWAASTTDRIMAACAPDIAALWKDPAVRTILVDFFGIRVECEAGL